MSPGTSNFWKENLHQELATLHLPGPSVIIDVRRGSDHDPPLVWNLAVELEDLAQEMQMKHVLRWRHLTDFIDFIKITPLLFGKPAEYTTDFTITTTTGQHKMLTGADALIEELGRHHVDRVRNNRISAVRERETGAEDANFLTTPEQVTVRIFFIVDAEDKDSMVSAATYALWLKKWYHEDKESKYSGRDRRISTLAICMNVDPRRHHPHMLAQLMDQTSSTNPALEAVVLMQIYSDDEAFIGTEIQSYQIESILYVLLLISEENLVNTDRHSIENQQLSLDLYADNSSGQLKGVPWSVTLIGISSLEYSARWATRWLDYGLVTRIIEIMQDKEEVQQEDLQGLLRREVQQQLQIWQNEVSHVVSNTLIETLPELRALQIFQQMLVPSPFQDKVASSLQDFDLFTHQLRQLYTGEEMTLQSAIDYASLSVIQLKKAYTQGSIDTEEPSTQDIYQQFMRLKRQAEQIPTTLFHGTRGMLPRVLLQMQALKENIAKIQDRLKDAPDVLLLREQFEVEVHLERQHLESLLKTRQWQGPFARKPREQRQKIIRKLCTLASTHLDQVREIILTKIMLALLQEAGLYNSKEVNSRYHQQIRRFETAVQKAYESAAQQQERAYERLKISLDKTQGDTEQGTNWLNLSSRKDILSWEQIIEAFEQFYSHLASVPTSLNLLMQWTLQLIATENPLLITRQYISKVREFQGPLTTDQETKLQMQTSNTVLVGVLLLLAIVNFDIVALQPLLTQYIDLKDRSADEPSILENNILNLQSMLREAMLERATNRQSGKPVTDFALKGEVPIERIMAAWVRNQYTNDPVLAQIFNSNDVLLHLAKQHVTPAQILDDLRMRNRVAGYREMMTGEDRFYLLAPPGEASQDFVLQDRDLLYSTQIHQIRFPDREKLIYLHVHQIHHIIPDVSMGKSTDINHKTREQLS